MYLFALFSIVFLRVLSIAKIQFTEFGWLVSFGKLYFRKKTKNNSKVEQSYERLKEQRQPRQNKRKIVWLCACMKEYKFICVEEYKFILEEKPKTVK